MSDDHTYLEQLERSLRRRGLAPDQTTAVIREITDHLAQSGERPLEAFGEPEQYAAALVAADQPEGDPEQSYEARTFRATATDEMEILGDLGLEGWELTGVRDFGLHARRPESPEARRTWAYARRTGARSGSVLAEMEPQGWAPCGRWLLYHYFKRAAA